MDGGKRIFSAEDCVYSNNGLLPNGELNYEECTRKMNGFPQIPTQDDIRDAFPKMPWQKRPVLIKYAKKLIFDREKRERKVQYTVYKVIEPVAPEITPSPAELMKEFLRKQLREQEIEREAVREQRSRLESLHQHDVTDKYNENTRDELSKELNDRKIEEARQRIADMERKVREEEERVQRLLETQTRKRKRDDERTNGMRDNRDTEKKQNGDVLEGLKNVLQKITRGEEKEREKNKMEVESDDYRQLMADMERTQNEYERICRLLNEDDKSGQPSHSLSPIHKTSRLDNQFNMTEFPPTSSREQKWDPSVQPSNVRENSSASTHLSSASSTSRVFPDSFPVFPGTSQAHSYTSPPNHPIVNSRESFPQYSRPSHVFPSFVDGDPGFIHSSASHPLHSFVPPSHPLPPSRTLPPSHSLPPSRTLPPSHPLPPSRTLPPSRLPPSIPSQSSTPPDYSAVAKLVMLGPPKFTEIQRSKILAAVKPNREKIYVQCLKEQLFEYSGKLGILLSPEEIRELLDIWKNSGKWLTI